MLAHRARAESARSNARVIFSSSRVAAPPRRGDSRARRGVPRPPVARRVSGASTRNDVSRTRDALERHCVTRDRIDFGDDVEADWCLSIERCVPLDARVRRRVRRARRGRRRTVRRQSLGKALEGAIDARFERRAREFVPRGAGKRAFCMFDVCAFALRAGTATAPCAGCTWPRATTTRPRELSRPRSEAIGLTRLRGVHTQSASEMKTKKKSGAEKSGRAVKRRRARRVWVHGRFGFNLPVTLEACGVHARRRAFEEGFGRTSSLTKKLLQAATKNWDQVLFAAFYNAQMPR